MARRPMRRAHQTGRPMQLKRPDHRRRHLRSGLAIVVALSTVAASCGRDGETADTAAPSTTAAASTAVSTTPDTAASGSSTSVDAAGSSSSVADSTTSTVAAPGPGDFGTLTKVCGPGDAKGATAQGVTDNEILVGTASDPANTASPGLNQGIFDVADAFVKWCNEAGGINGRQLKVNKHDGKLFEAGAAMIEACRTDFMLVGPGLVMDNTAVEPRVSCGLSQVAAFTVSPEAGAAPLSISAMSNSINGSNTYPLYTHLAEKDPSVVGKAAYWNLSFPSARPNGLREKAGSEKAGFTTVVYDELPTSVDNWRPYVERLKAEDVQVLQAVTNPATFVGALKAMEDIGYFPKYMVMLSSYYDLNFIKEAGALLDKTTMLVSMPSLPFTSADKYPVVKQFQELLQAQTNNPPQGLSIQALSAWLLWAQSATACGSDLTRECVMAKAVEPTSWTAGGIHRPTKPGNSSVPPNDCYAILHATSAGYEQDAEYYTANTDGFFDCDPKWGVPVEAKE